MQKNLIILFIEIVVIFLMALKIVPLEAGLFLTGLLIFYFLFSPLADALWLFIASIPLFVALPMTESFNSMSSWRILLAVLFLICLMKLSKNYCLSDPLLFAPAHKRMGQSSSNSGETGFRSKAPKFLGALLLKSSLTSETPKAAKFLTQFLPKMNLGSPLFILILIFLAIGILSLFNATSLTMGIKKILYLLNIFMLYFVIKAVVKDKKSFLKIIRAVGLAMGLVLVIGYTQFISVFFVPLYNFWQFWARNVIPIFYGQALSELLSYSNTWFSYYAEALPTLRIFSVFPDSHSFALFLILGLPFLIALTVAPRSQAPKWSLAYLIIYFLIFLSLLAAILSGSRGVWVSALVPLVISLILIVIFRSKPAASRSISRGFLAEFILSKVKGFRMTRQIKIPKILTASMIIFFLLFPFSSLLLNLSQKAQGAIAGQETDLIFARAKSILNLSELSAKGRIEIWQKTLDSIAAHPVLGVGIGNYPAVINEEMAAAKRGASAHNLYLDITAEMGIFALLILLLIFWEILRRAWQVFIQAKDLFYKTFAAAFTLYFIWLLAYNLFDVVLLNDKVFLLFVVAVGLLYSVPIWTTPERVSSRTGSGLSSRPVLQ